MMNERTLLRCARFLSALFSPFYMTFAVFVCILFYSFRRLLYVGFIPSVWGYMILLFMVMCFTVILPQLSIVLFRRIMKQGGWVSSQRRSRTVPYIIAILSYLACIIMLSMLNAPTYLLGLVVSALVSIMLCALINVWWKVSTHMVALGGVTAVIGICGMVMNFNPLFYLCLLFLLSGVVGTSRMILRQHTLSQVLWSYVLGLACSAYFFLKGF